jgi:hypothetical protein
MVDAAPRRSKSPRQVPKKGGGPKDLRQFDASRLDALPADLEGASASIALPFYALHLVDRDQSIRHSDGFAENGFS